MITHIVLFKLKDRRPEEITKARKKLMELAGRVPQLRSFEVGADIVRSERAFDLALLAAFDSWPIFRPTRFIRIMCKSGTTCGAWPRPLCPWIMKSSGPLG